MVSLATMNTVSETMVPDYVPHSFYRRPFERYPATWEIVSSREAIDLMREMTNQGQPAVGALHRLPRFRQLVNDVDSATPDWSHKFRQMVGHMCRWIMESLGLEMNQMMFP